MAIIVAVITQTFQSSQATTGWMCAFGLSSLALSSASIVLGMVWKLKDRESDAELLLGHHQPAPTESLAEKLTAECPEKKFQPQTRARRFSPHEKVCLNPDSFCLQLNFHRAPEIYSQRGKEEKDQI